MNAKRLAQILAPLLVITFIIASCAQPTPEVIREPVKETVIVAGTPVEITKEVVSTVVVEVTPTPQPKDQARAEQLNIAINGPIADPTNLNIYSPAVSRSNTGLHQMIYEYFFYDNLQTGEYIPWLATDYAYNSDFTSITVHLRDGVTWSDGEPFTADDVVFTYGLLRDNPGMTWASEANKWVKSVVADDDHTVTFNLTAANPRFHLIREAFPAVGIWGGLTILPKHVWEGQDPLTFKSSPPIGTGPYKLANATSNVMSYERRDDWWGTKVFGVTPGPKFVNFMYVGPSTSVALALASDELDSPNIGILSLSDFLAVKDRNPNLAAWSNEAPYTWLDPCPRALMVQNATPPWDKKEARWGLSFL
jgi:peptide/nickel transport system substrate-binding protein